MRTIETAAEALTVTTDSGEWEWMSHQTAAFDRWIELTGLYGGSDLNMLAKMLVFYPTGKGKTEIMLTCMYLVDVKRVVVVAPPVTHARWRRVGHALGIQVDTISHAKYRMKDTAFYSTDPIIVDEFHLLGKQTGAGWKKFDAHMRKIKAPAIIGSATPEYNEAERVYCVMHALDAPNNKGGFIGWLYEHCITEQNPFGKMPVVVRLRNFASAEEMLASLPYAVYVPDEAPDISTPVLMPAWESEDFEEWNLDHSKKRVMASQMEKKHRQTFHNIIDPDSGEMRFEVATKLLELLDKHRDKPVLVYLVHSEIAKLVYAELKAVYELNVTYIDGDTPSGLKDKLLDEFVAGQWDILVGTATLATGRDGIDKVSDAIIILDDTDDNAHRRQLIGRVLPRGVVKPADYVGKVAYRFVFTA